MGRGGAALGAGGGSGTAPGVGDGGSGVASRTERSSVASADVESMLSLGVGTISPSRSSSSELSSASSSAAICRRVTMVSHSALFVGAAAHGTPRLTCLRSSSLSNRVSNVSLCAVRAPCSSSLRVGALRARASCSSLNSCARAYSRFWTSRVSVSRLLHGGGLG